MQEPIPSLLHRDAYSAHRAGRRVLLIAGLYGSADDTMLALQVLKLVSSNSAQVERQIAISAIPNANPRAARDLSSAYPPDRRFLQPWGRTREALPMAVYMLASP